MKTRVCIVMLVFLLVLGCQNEGKELLQFSRTFGRGFGQLNQEIPQALSEFWQQVPTEQKQWFISGNESRTFFIELFQERIGDNLLVLSKFHHPFNITPLEGFKRIENPGYYNKTPFWDNAETIAENFPSSDLTIFPIILSSSSGN